MTTQKTFKARARARAAKTGESYTAARAQLLHHADAPAAPPEPEPPPDTRALTGVSESALLAATGRPFAEWLSMLDRWGATERTHAEIATWLNVDHEVAGWWSQTLAVGYERARGMRARHQNAAGFTVSVSRTIVSSSGVLTEAFTDERRRAAWLPDAPMSLRTGTSGGSIRFDWADPPSRVVVWLGEKGDRTQAVVAHERLPDASAVEHLKPMWREALGRLKALLEAGDP
jgi:hypothetical protein